MHTVERELTLRFAPFARESLAEAAARQRLTLAGLLRHAALYYLAESASGRLAARIPRFAKRRQEEPRHTVPVRLERSEWRRLEEAAESNGVPVATLIEHAAGLYVADWDSGRVASRLL